MAEPASVSDDAPPVKHLDLKARLMLLVVLLLIGSAVGYVLYARGFFERTQTLYLIGDHAEGVVVGMDLTFAGFPIGRVARIELSEEGNARIVVDVPVDDSRWLRTSSVFTMESGLVGAPRLRAYSGVLNDPPLPDGAERKLLAGDAFTEVQKLMSSIRDLVGNLNSMTGSESALNAGLLALRTTADRLNGPGGVLGVLLGDEAESRKIMATMERANALMERLSGLAGNADRLTSRLNDMTLHADKQVFGDEGVMPEVRQVLRQMNILLADARGSLRRIDAVLTDAQAISGQARDATVDLGALRADVESSLRKVEQLVDEVNRKWPFAREAEIRLP